MNIVSSFSVHGTRVAACLGPVEISTNLREEFTITKNIVKLREREGQRVDLGRSLKGHLWMVDGGWWISFP